MYKDFDDLKENCQAEIQADIAVDFLHDDPAALAAFWPVTTDGEFRLGLTQRVSDYWERAIREKGGDNVPEDCLAIEILVDSYGDPDMGHSLYLELHVYCGTDGIGDLTWSVFDTSELEAEFGRALPGRIMDLVGRLAPGSGVTCEIEITEVAEL